MSLAFRVAGGVACLVLVACKPAPAPVGLDTRTAVTLPAEANEAVRAEMRTMLTSLHQLHLGLATHDTALAHRAAVASGLAAAADPALEPLLPEEFLRLGVASHSEFDSLATAITLRAPAESLLARLPRITANCIACHAIYRLGPAESPRL